MPEPLNLDALFLPGELPGLLRMGSVVRALDLLLGECGILVLLGTRGVVVKTEERDGRLKVLVAWEQTEEHGEVSDPLLLWCEATRIGLDLTDETGRAHAAWWVEANSRGVAGGPAMRSALNLWCRRCCADPDDFALYWRLLRRSKALAALLSGLNPEDPRLLPDGLRWVDAEALRRVCLHVAGREVVS